MLAKWPIRNKLLAGIALLVVLVATLATTGFLAVDSYRSLLQGLQRRAVELPLSSKLSREVNDLQLTLHDARHIPIAGITDHHLDVQLLRERFRMSFQAVRETLDVYREQLNRDDLGGSGIADNRRERETIARIDEILSRIDRINLDQDWMLKQVQSGRLDDQLKLLQRQADELPGYLHRRLQGERDAVRGRYRAMHVLVWAATGGALLIFVIYIQLFYRWVVCPLRTLVRGSRKVAGGAFSHRIRLDTNDEMAELATALNDMTRRFQDIRDDLDRQVKDRTKQVVRNEQLASVGFLAAGVAHEINNPLASIAMCAESLDRRAAEFLSEDDPEHAEVRDYLKMIQDEAFRCKDITENLLDFSRTGDLQRHETDLRELVSGVMDMVRHLGKRQGKRLDLLPGDPVIASVGAQQIKQVVLNLITNALDSVESGGAVTVSVQQRGDKALITFTDDGCGMTEEVLEHLFEPFYTQRRGGQGTGLGLAIVYRIITDHDGAIQATSEGPGRGSQLCVSLPLSPSEEQHKEHDNRNQAA